MGFVWNICVRQNLHGFYHSPIHIAISWAYISHFQTVTSPFWLLRSPSFRQNLQQSPFSAGKIMVFFKPFLKSIHSIFWQTLIAAVCSAAPFAQGPSQRLQDFGKVERRKIPRRRVSRHVAVTRPWCIMGPSKFTPILAEMDSKRSNCAVMLRNVCKTMNKQWINQPLANKSD